MTRILPLEQRELGDRRRGVATDSSHTATAIPLTFEVCPGDRLRQVTAVKQRAKATVTKWQDGGWRRNGRKVKRDKQGELPSR